MQVMASNQPEQFDWAINDRIDQIVKCIFIEKLLYVCRLLMNSKVEKCMSLVQCSSCVFQDYVNTMQGHLSSLEEAQGQLGCRTNVANS